MEMNEILAYMSQYGLFFLALIIFLEYLNLPGFPAGIILPIAGMWAASSKINFGVALSVSVVAALVASWILYAVGWYGGEFLLGKYTKKFPKQKDYIDEKLGYLRDKGNFGVFISKLIPMARTIISVPAGVLKLNFLQYSIYSTLGIAIWNGVLMAAGYFLGQEVLTMWM
ncbi:MAG: DedA family protein [Cellulosilyticaceae bacterium]